MRYIMKENHNNPECINASLYPKLHSMYIIPVMVKQTQNYKSAISSASVP